MSLRVLLFPLKVIALVSMVFASPVERVLILAGVLLLFVILPKVGTMISLIRYSGFMRSSAGIIYMVDSDERGDAMAQGFREVSLFTSATLTGDIKKWHPEGG